MISYWMKSTKFAYVVKLSDTRKLVFVGVTYAYERSELQKLSFIVKFRPTAKWQT